MAVNAEIRGAYRDWTRVPERGSPRLVAFIAGLAGRLPRRPVSLLLYPIVAYFVAFSPRQVTASREFLLRAWGREPCWHEVFAHYLTFAQMVLDRVYWLSRKKHRIPVRIHGLAAVESALAGRSSGIVVVGSHLGSFEALRGAGEPLCGRRIRPVMFVANARKTQQVLDAINPQLTRDVIFAGRPATMLAIREALEQGDIVGILADRTPLAEKSVRVPFMGGTAPFPVGAYRVAALVGAPVVFSCALLAGAGYEIFFERMDEGTAPVSRAARERWTLEQATRFAQHLERYACAYPLNWFNFYDFWQGDVVQEPAGRRGAW